VSESNSDLTQLRGLFASQPLAVLSTDGNGHPYASLVAFAVSDDLRRLFFATSRDTRKFANLQSNSQVALLVDNRSNSVADFTRAVAVTVLGSCRELSGTERSDAERLYLEKHPHLEEFVSSPGCALIHVTVRSFYLVSCFRNVTEHHFEP
jgi:nitroimidazol reductase NimA-like FMN-containing flavoprotein (pyridoxamine 5'-phosphate oxidase superfamily)